LKTAEPLLDQTVTIRDAKTGRYSEYTLSTPVTVTGRFYVGYAAVVIGNESLYLVPTATTPTPPGRTWISATVTGSTPQDFAAAASTLDPLNYCFPLRASGGAGAITYQGRLADGGSSFSGPADMQFRFFDSPSGPTPLSPKFTNLSVPVNQGIFAAGLPGDANWFTNAPDVYLEIEVRRGGDDYVTLSPRQRITRSPASLHAVVAATSTLAQSVPWSGVTGIPASVANAFSPWNTAASGIVYSGGRVGIGISSPSAPLHVASGAVGTGWQFQLTNSAALPTYETGMRMSDGGFFEITNRINGFNRLARLDSNGGWTSVSDARLKTDLTPFDGALDAALRLRPVRFKWTGDGASDFGFVAQQLRTVLPDAVVGDEAHDSLTVNYSKLSTVAIGAIQEQQKKIDRLEAENRKLRERLERIEAALLDGGAKRSSW